MKALFLNFKNTNMKSILILLIVGLGYLTTPTELSETVGTTMVGAEVGAPSQSCAGFGLCLIVNSSLKELDVIERKVFGEITLGRDGNIRTFNVFSKYMTDDIRKNMFSGESFIMNDAIKGQLKMGNGEGDGSYYIAAGKYPMQETKDGFLITFK